MKLIPHKHIDKKKWDESVANSSIENVFMYSWYLDAVSPNWMALVDESYCSIFPIVSKKRLGVTHCYQPKFTREFDCISTNGKSFSDVFNYLKSKFNSVQLRNKLTLEGSTKRIHQELDLRAELNFKTNAKRIIKKSASKFNAIESQDPSELINLFKRTTLEKIDTLKLNDLSYLKNLMHAALKHKKGRLYYIYENTVVKGGAFFLEDKKRITLLKSAAEPQAKKEGAMYFLLNNVISEKRKMFDTFDFGGSNESNVREFYLKFGAHDSEYAEHLINKVPKWYKATKKILKKT